MRLGVELGRELGRMLPLFPEFDGIDLLVPVPLHAARRRERGYNQAETIATGISIAMARPVAASMLVRRRHTGSQTTLGAEARRSNMVGAFGTSGHVDGARVLLCDDVCTTGATLNACAEALLAAGAGAVCAAAVAKDEV
jgi:ComF family protein